MKVILENKDCVIQGSPKEIRRSKSLLTWTDSQGFSYNLYKKIDDNTIKTYWGSYFYIKDYINHELEVKTDYYPILLRLGKVEPNIVNISKDILPGISLFDHQLKGVRKAFLYKTGVLEMATGSGKTETFIATIKWLLENENSDAKFLVVVPSEYLLNQTYERFLKYGFTRKQVSKYYSKQKKVSQITIGLINSLTNAFRNHELTFLTWFNNVYGVIVDECHHIRGDTYKTLLVRSMNYAEYILGYSGSPYKESVEVNYGDAVVQAVTGGVIYRVPMSYLVKEGLLATMYCYFDNVPGNFHNFPTNWNSVYDKYIVNNKERNDKILNWIRFFQEWKVPTLVLIQRLEHGKKLLNQLKSDKAVCVFGGGNCFIYEHGLLTNIGEIDYSVLKSKVEKGEILTIIASQVMDEGVDLPDVGAVIMAGAGKSSIKLKQRLGRGARKGKTGVSFLIDFKDNTHVFLFSQYKKRRNLYEEQAVIHIDDSVEFRKKVIEVYGGKTDV